MIAAQPVHGVQTRVVAVSPAQGHRPFHDGRVWLGDTVGLSIRDTTIPPADSLRYRVCITVPTFHSTRCKQSALTCNWPGDPVVFNVRYNAAATVRWYNGRHLIAERKLRVTGGD